MKSNIPNQAARAALNAEKRMSQAKFLFVISLCLLVFSMILPAATVVPLQSSSFSTDANDWLGYQAFFIPLFVTFSFVGLIRCGAATLIWLANITFILIPISFWSERKGVIAELSLLSIVLLIGSVIELLSLRVVTGLHVGFFVWLCAIILNQYILLLTTGYYVRFNKFAAGTLIIVGLLGVGHYILMPRP